MHPDILSLRQFYSSRLGRKVRRRLRGVVRDYWPGAPGLHLVGVGYTTDLLPLPSDKTYADNRIVALMPAEQGALYWPLDAMNHTTLADTLRPPFIAGSLHRVLMTHAFEHHPAPSELLAVWWQLLVPGGRLLLMVPNRRGLWARVGATPFAGGTAYRLGDLRALLNAAGFTLRDSRTVLFAPPSTHPFWLRAFGLLEWLGSLLMRRLGGVLVVEAEKQIYAGVKTLATAPRVAKSWQPTPALSASKEALRTARHGDSHSE
jgi:SAM-dependent methyltransferase